MPADLIPALDAFLEKVSVAQKMRKLQRTERAMERALGLAFTTQGKLFVDRFAQLEDRFAESVGAADWLTFWDEVTSITEDLFWSPIETGIQTSMEAGAAEVLADLGSLAIDISFSLDHPVAVEYVRRQGAELVTSINETTREYINTVVTRGVDEGWSYNRMAKALTDRFEEFAVGKPQAHIQSRAHLIAVTEAGNAYESAGRAVVNDLEAAGLVMEKAWLDVGDDKVSDGCRENAEAGWIPLAQEFPSGHQHPTRFPGCRCSCTYRRRRSA